MIRTILLTAALALAVQQLARVTLSTATALPTLSAEAEARKGM